MRILFVLFLSLAAIQILAPSHALSEGQNSPQQAIKLTPMTGEEASKHFGNKETFLVLLSSETCGACKPMEEAIESLPIKDLAGLPLYFLKDIDRSWQDKLLPGVPAIPVIYYIREGQIIDRLVGSFGPHTVEKTRQFIARNTSKPPMELHPWNKDTLALKKALLQGHLQKPWDFSRQDLRNTYINNTIFTGSKLHRTDFRGAKLKQINFHQTDLTGALFEGAVLNDIHWGDSICPDGTPSTSHNLTCKGHLNARTLKPEPSGYRTCAKAMTQRIENTQDKDEKKILQYIIPIRCGMPQTVNVSWKNFTFSALTPKEAKEKLGKNYPNLEGEQALVKNVTKIYLLSSPNEISALYPDHYLFCNTSPRCFTSQ